MFNDFNSGLENFNNPEELWAVRVLNDDINLASFVQLMLTKLLSKTSSQAAVIVKEIHNTGHADIFEGPEPEALQLVFNIHSYGVKAVMYKVTSEEPGTCD